MDLESRPCRARRSRAPRAPVVFVVEEPISRLILALPPTDGQPEWRWIDSDGEGGSFHSFRDWWRGRGNPELWCDTALELERAATDADDDDSEVRGDPTAGGRRGWFWSAVWDCRGDFLQVVPASVMINLFALAMPLFVMNVYDRVVPNAAFDSLWVLASGIAIIFAFEFVLRILRGAFVDAAGKRADAVLARRVYRQTLDMELAARPASAGNFAGLTRGYETVREFLSSLTLLGLLDFPFGLMMFALIFVLGGVVGWVPVISSALVIVFLLILQPFLAKHAYASHEDRVQRQALMAESANGIESIKAVGGGPRLEKRMGAIIDQSASIDLKTRKLTQMGSAFTTLCIHMTTVGVIVLGTYQISEGAMTMGGLIACVMIVGRGMAPLNQVSQLLLRLQSTRAALKGLDAVMATERESDHRTLRKHLQTPEIRVSRARFQYEGQPVPALDEVSFRVTPGERIGIIGKAGSGKSTLLRMLNRQLRPTSGLVLMDGVDVTQIDPVMVRQCCGYLPQDGFLFHGTVKDNIALGGAGYTDEEIIDAAQRGGVLPWANRHPQGLEMDVGERGVLLSGGQRQTVMLARTMIGNPDVLLLDEPTASLDLGAEKGFQQMVEKYLGEDGSRTLILSTHKLSMLKLVDRVILMDQAKVVMDGPREKVLEALQSKGEDERGGGGPASAAPELHPATPQAAAAPTATDGNP